MSAREKRITILDIAHEADVSAATVSRVLNNREYPVSEELRNRILKIAKRLKYRPNIFSQVLKGGENRVVGVVVPSIANPFYSQLISDVETICIASSRPLIICGSRHNPRLELEHLEMLERQQVAGILLSTMNDGKAFVERLSNMAAPCVVFDQLLEGYEGGGVIFDFRRGGYLATRHLVAQGHRRIAFASTPLDRPSRRLIFEGYRNALDEAGIDAPPDLTAIVEADGRGSDLGAYQGGRVLADRMRETLPDAVFAVNDIIAIGIINALSEKGVRVPRDISVVGFDDIPLASMTTPSLTTVRQSTAQTAELAMDILFKKIASPARTAVREVVEPVLVERASVKRAGGAFAKKGGKPTRSR